jgi:uncharacterized protein YlxW (UPF0749 family)
MPEPRESYSVPMLDRIMADAMEPGYADRAAEKQRSADAAAVGGAPPPADRRTTRSRRVVHVAVALVLLASGFVLTLRIGDVRRSAPDAAAARTELAERVQQRTLLTDGLAAEVAALRSTVGAARDSALVVTRNGRERAKALAALELATGAVPVSGPGLRVTVSDAPSKPQDGEGADQADLGQVQDRDLQLVVNGLWAAGAEAIAVGGYRLTARTAIRSAGEAILVDFRPITEPYVIEAIGDPETMRARFLEGPGGRALSTLNATYGIRFTSESVDNLRLPAADSLGDLGAPRGGAR